jgi:hypothetical protein
MRPASRGYQQGPPPAEGLVVSTGTGVGESAGQLSLAVWAAAASTRTCVVVSRVAVRFASDSTGMSLTSRPNSLS